MIICTFFEEFACQIQRYRSVFGCPGILSTTEDWKNGAPEPLEVPGWGLVSGNDRFLSYVDNCLHDPLPGVWCVRQKL